MSILLTAFSALIRGTEIYRQPRSPTFAMAQLIAFDAILFPADGRPPHLVALMTSPMTIPMQNMTYSHSRLPHPEHYMSFVADGLGHRAWKYQVRSGLCRSLSLFTSLTHDLARGGTRRHEQEVCQSIHNILSCRLPRFHAVSCEPVYSRDTRKDVSRGERMAR